jgi:hypothetical protein
VQNCGLQENKGKTIMGKRKTFKIQEKTQHRGASKISGSNFPIFKFLLGMAFLGVLGSQLFFFNRLATEGGTLKALEQKKAVLMQQKISLEQTTINLSSLSRIDRESREKLGMTAGSKNVQFITPDKIASLR